MAEAVLCAFLAIATAAVIAFAWLVVMVRRRNTTTFTQLGRNNFWTFVFRATCVLALAGVWIGAILLVFSLAWYFVFAITTVSQVATAAALSMLKGRRAKSPGQ